MTLATTTPQKAPMGRTHRISSESSWPLRGPDGLTFAERKALRDAEKQAVIDHAYTATS